MTIVFAILLFSFLIFIHELGHFLAAKASGVRVVEFALFMGPAIFKKTVGETTYSLRCIPIGGFCQMEGEDEESDDPHAFGNAAWWKRIIILVAGAAMNLIAGFLLLFIVNLPAQGFVTPQIVESHPASLIVREDGLQVGDRILQIDGENVYVASDFSMLLSLDPKETYDILVDRQGEKVFLDDFAMVTVPIVDENGVESQKYGITFGVEENNFLNSLKYTWYNTLDTVRTVRLSLKMLLTGQAGLMEMSGPVGIVQIMSDTAAQSDGFLDALLNLLYFGGFIAINLAVMNLLPIPALDGGRVVGLLLTVVIEKITRKKLNSKYEAIIHGVGMVLLLILMAVILFKDVFVIFKG